MVASESMISISDLTCSYSPQQGFTLPHWSLQQGAQVALVGRSGSGKSTVLNLLAGLLPVTSGSLLINGQQLTGLTETQRDQFRREHIGVIFQTYQLLDEFTALENIQMGHYFSHRTSQQEALGLLEKVGLSEMADGYPSQLSVGQRQRIAVCRALIKSPSLILADEPTGALDHESGERICQLLRELATEHNSTLIFVTHDTHLASQFPEQLQVEDLITWNNTNQRRTA